MAVDLPISFKQRVQGLRDVDEMRPLANVSEGEAQDRSVLAKSDMTMWQLSFCLQVYTLTYYHGALKIRFIQVAHFSTGLQIQQVDPGAW